MFHKVGPVDDTVLDCIGVGAFVVCLQSVLIDAGSYPGGFMLIVILFYTSRFRSLLREKGVLTPVELIKLGCLVWLAYLWLMYAVAYRESISIYWSKVLIGTGIFTVLAFAANQWPRARGILRSAQW